MPEIIERNVNINNFEFLSPVTAASLLNTCRLEELIALQKGETFNSKESMKQLIKKWLDLSLDIQKTAKSHLTNSPCD